MSDTQDDLDKRIEAVKQFCGCDERSSVLVDVVVRTCRAHFQRHAEPVAWKDTMVTEYADVTIEKEPMLLEYEGWEQLPDGTELYTSPPIPADMVRVPARWKTIIVNEYFEPLIKALHRADRKGYLPDAIQEDWDDFQYWVSPTPVNKEGA